MGTVAHVHGTDLRIEIAAHVGEVNRAVFRRHMVDNRVVATFGVTGFINAHVAHPGLRLGIHAFERIEVLDRFHDAVISRLEGGNRTVFIPREFFDRGRTAVSATACVFLVVIEEEATALKIDDTAVVRKGIALTRFHDDSTPGPRARRRIAGGVRNLFALSGTMRSVKHVVLVVALVDPRAFGVHGVAIRREAAAHVEHLDFAVELNHIFLELGVIKFRVAHLD